MNRVTTTLRLPADANDFLEAQAIENASSKNSEIVRAIRERMKMKDPASVAALPGQGHQPTLEKADEHQNR